MGLAVASYQSGPVHGKYDRQILKAHIMKDLVISSLQKRRVYCHHRAESGGSHACGTGDRMLLGDTHVEKSVRKYGTSCGSRFSSGPRGAGGVNGVRE